jgi:DNA excision repair protein ERCC-4
MLNKIVPIHLISGIIANHAEFISESSSEAFILRLYREENKAGFIKAFTDRPDALVNGIGKLERLCKSLLVRNVHAWPRFHVHVAESINVQVDLVELRVGMTSRMVEIQALLLECLGACLTEVKKSSLLVSIAN